MLLICGPTVAEWGLDADEWRVSHSRGSQVSQGVVIGPLAPATSRSKTTGCAVRERLIRLSLPTTTERDVLLAVKAQRDLRWVEPKRRQAR